jgi:hypothetical protein
MHTGYLQSSDRLAESLHLLLAVCAVTFGAGCSDSSGTAGGAKGKGADGGNLFANVATTGTKGGTSGVRSDGGRTDGSSGLVQLTKTCGASQFGAAPIQVNVLLVIDKSGSMLDKPQGFSNDKWTEMKSSLSSSLQAVQDKIWLGLELFPHAHCELPSGSDMDVDVQEGSKALPLVQMALDGATPEGGTPTATALSRALDYYTKGGGAQLSGHKYVLLATDGGPNCNSGLSCGTAACTVNLDGKCPMGVMNCCDTSMGGPGAQTGCLDDQETLKQIKALATAGIDTFVVGIPGTESYAASLDAFAQAGGRVSPSAPPSYYAVSASGSGAGGLTSVLDSITSSLIKSCRLQLSSTPPAANMLNVQVDGQLVAQNGPDGWDIDSSTDPQTLVLKGKTCSKIESEGVQSVSVLYGCPTIIQ